MRAVIQRIRKAKVNVDNEQVVRVNSGLLIFLGVEKGDQDSDVDYILSKVLGLRIFGDDTGKMNLSIEDINGEILVVSQFTLLADCRKGKRPSFDNAEYPKEARELYEKFVEQLGNSGIRTQSGVFGVNMDVELLNDGPVTILLDSKKLF